MNETDLRDVLDRASDAIEAPQLAASARKLAHRGQTRRRGIAAAALVSVGVATIVVATQLGGDRADVLPPIITPSPSPSMDNDVPLIRPGWDPRDVDELDWASNAVAPALPDVIDPPEESPPLTESPIDAAVLVVAVNSEAQLLATDGTWRSLELPGRYPGVILSPDGTRLGVVDDDDALEVYDLPSGERRSVPFPEGYRDWDYTTWTWVDEQTLLLNDLNEGGWLVESTTGQAQRVPFPGVALSWSLDSDGAVVESADWTEPAAMTDWANGQARRVPMDLTGRLSSMHADADNVVGTSYDISPFAVVVADRETLTPRTTLRIRDYDANYSNGGLSVLALLDDGSVLLRVAVFGREDGFRIVHWQPETGELSRVSSSSPTVYVTFAQGLIRRSDP